VGKKNYYWKNAEILYFFFYNQDKTFIIYI